MTEEAMTLLLYLVKRQFGAASALQLALAYYEDLDDSDDSSSEDKGDKQAPKSSRKRSASKSATAATTSACKRPRSIVTSRTLPEAFTTSAATPSITSTAGTNEPVEMNAHRPSRTPSHARQTPAPRSLAGTSTRSTTNQSAGD